MSRDDALAALREALRLSPDNLPLRLHLGDTLLGLARYDEAEREYREGLSMAPGDVRFKLGLANAFLQGGKASAAMVVAEELIRDPNPPAKAHLLYSKLLLRAGEVDRAVRQYKRAVEADESVADPDLAAQLGIHRSTEEAQSSEVMDGKVRSARGRGTARSWTLTSSGPRSRSRTSAGWRR